jgi:hypothetical protein
MANSKSFFLEIQSYLLSYEHVDRCSNEYIHHFCNIYSSIFETLDTIKAKPMIKCGSTTDDDYNTLEWSLIVFSSYGM